MWVSDKWTDYELLDASRGEKLERWGDKLLLRPDPQAIWETPRTDPRWNRLRQKLKTPSSQAPPAAARGRETVCPQAGRSATAL